MAPPQPDWLRHVLTISGPAIEVRTFQEAACGAGAIPWALPDLSTEEEDRFYALVTPPDGTQGLRPEAARVLARLLRAAEEAHADRVARAARQSRDCPFDLHALIPVPSDLLRRGADDPASRAWLRGHWGVVRALRQVRRLPGREDRRRRRSAQLDYEFWSADWTPWAALARLRADWPALLFDCRPDYANC